MHSKSSTGFWRAGGPRGTEAARRGAAALAGALALCLAAWSGAAGERMLYVYTWEDYVAPEVVAAFEASHDCRVDFTYYDSNEVMYETLLSGGSGYDLLTPSANNAAALRRDGALAPLELDRIPNLYRLIPDTPLLELDPECRYLIPFTGTVVVVGYNRALVPPDLRGGWGIFAAPQLAGKVAMLNDLRETLGAALRHLGYSANTTDAQEIQQAAGVLREWKKNLAMFDVVRARDQLRDGTLAAVQGYSGDMAKAIRENANLDCFVPLEGSTMNCDYFAVPANAESPDLAHAFINHLLDPEMARLNMEYAGFFMPNRAALDALPESMRRNPAFEIPPELIDRCEMIRLLGDGYDLYDEAWSAVLLD